MDISKERLDSAYEYALTTYQGRQFVWEVLCMTHVFDTLSDDHGEMLRQEGRRRLGLKLMAELEERHPEKYHSMLKEGKQRIKESNHDNRSSNTNGRSNERDSSSSGDSYSADDLYNDGGSAELPSHSSGSISGF